MLEKATGLEPARNCLKGSVLGSLHSPLFGGVCRCRPDLSCLARTAWVPGPYPEYVGATRAPLLTLRSHCVAFPHVTRKFCRHRGGSPGTRTPHFPVKSRMHRHLCLQPMLVRRLGVEPSEPARASVLQTARTPYPHSDACWCHLKIECLRPPGCKPGALRV
jgi:hypothetical protein